jgi:hypothetical protein
VRGFRLGAVLAASLAAGGCFLQRSSDGFAGGGSVAGNGGQGGDTPEGQGGSGAAAGAVGGGGAAGAMNCSALPFGCICAPSEPTQVAACTTSSVLKVAGQRGLCCDGAINCICVAYECVRTGGACNCQLAQPSLTGMRVDDCSGVTANPSITCCRGYGQCVCSFGGCLPTETQVSGCSVQDLLSCEVGETGVEGCEGAGTGRRGP